MISDPRTFLFIELDEIMYTEIPKKKKRETERYNEEGFRVEEAIAVTRITTLSIYKYQYI